MTATGGYAPHMPAPRDPVGILEIATRLGVDRNVVKQWKVKGLLPDPRWTVSGNPAWEWRDIERWAAKTGRLPAA